MKKSTRKVMRVKSPYNSPVRSGATAIKFSPAIKSTGKATMATTTSAKARRATTPVMKKSAMRKKSPYKCPTRAGKAAKKLSPAIKSAGKSLTKEEKMKLRARARDWARNELVRKKSSPAPPNPVSSSSRITVLDDDDGEKEEDWKVSFDRSINQKTVGNGKTRNSTYVMCGNLRECMSELDIENQRTQKTGTSTLQGSGEEDTFYDALEYLPADHGVAVEDVSDEEDGEICDLRSASRNRVPSRGQWMEPLDPDGISYSTFMAN